MFIAAVFIKVLNQTLPVSTISRMKQLSMAQVDNRTICNNEKRTHNNMNESQYKKQKKTRHKNSMYFMISLT